MVPDRTQMVATPVTAAMASTSVETAPAVERPQEQESRISTAPISPSSTKSITAATNTTVSKSFVQHRAIRRQTTLHQSVAREHTPVPTVQPQFATTGASLAFSPRLDSYFGFDAMKALPALKIDSKLPIGMIARHLLVIVVLAIGGYLAYDTWSLNNQLRNGTAVERNAAASQYTPANGTPDTTPVSNSLVASYRVDAEQPRTITISSINVEARIFAMGVASNGEIATPQNIYDTGWYTKSSRPGASGVMFVDAHYGLPNQPAVFRDINKLTPGSAIEIERGDGTKYTYVVHTVDVQAVKDISMPDVLRTHGADKELVLMTCAGTYDSKTNTYDKRAIVRAVAQ